MTDSTACAEPPLALHTLRAQLVQRLGAGVGIACTGVDGDPQALYPEEFATIQKAVPRRQREFAAGREAARLAMAQIGHPPAAILSAPDRAPIWPDGLIGSITHSASACVAVVGRREHLHAIGIDLEEDLPMEPALWGTICTPEELAWVMARPTPLQGTWATRLFSAKEAFYKWQYPITGQMLEFQQVHVQLDMQTWDFYVHTAASELPYTSMYRGAGQLLLVHGWVLACFSADPPATAVHNLER